MEAYLAGYDKAHKPYVPIDTCSPAGTWIEEKRYNRSRPTQSDSIGKRVLCGNWQEEALLESDMCRIEAEDAAAAAAAAEEGVTTTKGRGGGGAAPLSSSTAASLDVIKEVGPGRYAGGFRSSPYLTATAADPEGRHLQSTHRQDYCATSSDVTALRRANLGVRSQRQLSQAIAAAEEAQRLAKEETARRQAEHALQSLMSSKSGSQSAAAMAVALADPSTRYSESVYKATVSAARAHESTSHDKPVIDGLRKDYHDDEPITLYTGNPRNGKTMTVHGKTPVDPVSSTRFGKHTHFSEPKYHL